MVMGREDGGGVAPGGCIDAFESRRGTDRIGETASQPDIFRAADTLPSLQLVTSNANN